MTSKLKHTLALALVLGAPSMLAPTLASAQRGGSVVVQHEGGRRGGRRGGSVTVTPPAPPQPGRRGGTVVVTPPAPPHPGHRGGAVVVTPPAPPHPGHRGGAVVVTPPTPPRGPSVIIGPREVMRRPPSHVVVRTARPAPPAVRAPRPAPIGHGQVWIDAYWGWAGTSWQWIDGHWETPPQVGAVWVEPQWNGSSWTPGYWTMAQVYAQTPQFTGLAYQVGQSTSGFLTSSNPRSAAGPYQDYAVWLTAGSTVSFAVSGGPSDAAPGTRIGMSLSLLLDGREVATGSQSSPYDAQLTVRASRSGLHILRVQSQSGAYGTGSFVLQSVTGTWGPQVSAYDQYWTTPSGTVVITPR